MARISSYLNDGSLSGEDRLVGSNYIGVNNYQTNNFKLKDVSEFIQGQISISPSNSTLKTNGGVVTEIINGTSSLAIDLSATDITGQLANSDLANSSITINGTAVSLGGTITIGEVTEVTAGTYLNGGGTEGTVTLNHDDTTRTDTVSTDAPAYGDTFTVIDSLTTNSTGHVTAANVKTVTIPASDNTTYTIEAVASTNDSIIRLIDSDSNNDDIKLIAGDNISLSTNESNDTITINSQAFGTVFTVATESAMITATTTGGDIVIRTDVSKTFIHNGGSAGDVTDFSELQFSGINSIALTEGNGIELSRATLTNVDNDLTITNTLATTTERGGIQIGYTESGKNYPVELDSEKAYVNVPWANTNQLTTFTVRDSGDDDKLVAHGDFIKFVSATGTAGTNLSGTGTTSDPFVMTITSPDANTEYTSGGGLDLNGTVFSHTDTSAQESVDNSGRTYIQDITLDTYGHVTGLVSATETVTDTNQLTTWDLLDDDDDSFTIGHDTHVKFTSSEATYGTNVTGAGTEADPYIVAVTSPNDTVPNSFRTIKVDTDNDGTANETIDAAEELKLIGGTNVTLAEDAGKVTVTSSDTTNWNFKVDSGTAENIAASNTVTFTSGDGITLTQTDKTIDIAADFDGDYNSLTNKPTIPSGNQIIDWSVSQSGNTPAVINTDNYSNTQLSNTQVVAAIVASTDISGTDKGTFRTNIGAGTSSFDGDYDSLSNKPTLLQLGTTSSTALAGDTTIITQTQADAIVNNTAKVSFPGLGTTSTTALAGDTALFSGDYDDLSNKPTIPSGNAIIDWTIDQGDTNIDAGNYSNTQNTAAEIRTKVGTGNNGVVPAAGTAGHFLKHDGTFGLPSYTTNTNYYLDDITKSGNTLTFSVSGADNQTYTFGSNAFNSTAYLTAEADTLATVTGRGASTSTDTTLNSHLMKKLLYLEHSRSSS